MFVLFPKTLFLQWSASELQCSTYLISVWNVSKNISTFKHHVKTIKTNLKLTFWEKKILPPDQKVRKKLTFSTFTSSAYLPGCPLLLKDHGPPMVIPLWTPLILEAKQGGTWLVLGWENPWSLIWEEYTEGSSWPSGPPLWFYFLLLFGKTSN